MNHHSTKFSEGITLIEVIVVVAIAAILSMVAAPSFVSMTQRFRIITAASGFVGDLRFARSEAVRQGLPVTICASTDSATCSASAAWQSGWIVFADPLANLTVAKRLKVRPAMSNGDTALPNTGIASISFNRDGFPLTLGSASVVTFTMATTPANPNAVQCVSIWRTGRFQTGACS